MLSPDEARAEGPVTGTGKGIVGGALLGGEVVMLTMGAFGVEKTWPYLVFGGLGAVGGGVGGFFVEQNTDPRIPLYMLAGGMGLVIPTVVVVLNATSYKPGDVSEEPVTNEPSSNPPQPGEPIKGSITIGARKAPRGTHKTSRARKSELRAEPPRTSLVDLRRGQLALSVPAVEVRPVYSLREMQQYGVQQRNELRLPVFHALF